MTVHLGSASAGDVGVDAVAGGNIYQGIAPTDLLPMIADLLGNESQWRRADSAAREIRQQYLDRRLDRITVGLTIVGLTLIAQTLTLLIVGGITVAMLWPRLVGSL